MTNSTNSADWLTPDVVEAVCQHMNADHADDSLLLAQLVQPNATSARTIGVDTEALVLQVTTDESVDDVRLPWPGPVRQRSDIRLQVVALHQQALVAAGQSPAASPTTHRTDAVASDATKEGIS